MRDQQDILKGLEKGLDVLVMLNRGRGLRVADVARELDLPRTTALRILKTLAANGFIDRSDIDRRYRPTIKVRTLADGYDEDVWVAEIARSEVQLLTKKIGWPALLATPFGTSMVWRINTDHETPLALERLGIGMETLILGSACGRIFLAYCTDEERSNLMGILFQIEEYSPYLTNSAALAEMLVAIRTESCALHHQHSEYTLAVPVLLDGRYIASLAIRVMMRAMTPKEVVTRYHKMLTDVAEAITGKMKELSGANVVH